MLSRELDSRNYKYNPALLEQFVDQVVALTETDEWQKFLDFQRQFHRYSIGNVLLIRQQNPQASQVASMRKWNHMHRKVKAGSHGMKVWVPTPKKVVQVDSDGVEREAKKMYFKLGSVFDVSQTEGEPLPKPVRLLEQTAPLEALTNVAQLIQESGLSIDIVPGEELGTANGVFIPDQKAIKIREGLSEGQTLKTMIHELAHSRLHADLTELPRAVAEIEAESVAYLVCGQTFGLDSSNYSLGYVAFWGEGGEVGKIELADKVLKQAKRITKTAQEIDKQLEERLTKFRESEQARQIEVAQEVEMTHEMDPAPEIEIEPAEPYMAMSR